MATENKEDRFYTVYIHRKVNQVLYGLDAKTATTIRNFIWELQKVRCPKGYDRVQGVPDTYKVG